MLILGVLAERPMHGYEIQQWMKDSRTDLWAGVRPGSLYHALKQLDAEGLIKVKDVISQGERSRTVYQITGHGRTELRSLLTEGWGHSPNSYPVELYTLITFSRFLLTAEMREYAGTLRERVLQNLEEWNSGGRRKLAATNNDPLIAAMIGNGEAHLKADAELLRTIAKQ